MLVMCLKREFFFCTRCWDARPLARFRIGEIYFVCGPWASAWLGKEEVG